MFENEARLFSCGTFCSVPSSPPSFFFFLPSLITLCFDSCRSCLFITLWIHVLILLTLWICRCVSLSCLPLPLSFTSSLLFFSSHFALHISHHQNLQLPHMHPSLWPFSYLFPSITLSLLRHPSPPACLPLEIITTNLVKISLYLNSWISKARGCWQSLFNNSQVKQWSRK